MKARSDALAAAQSLGSTTLAWCWKAVRKDGAKFTVTNCARSFLFEGDVYLSVYGFSPSAITQNDTQAVANTEIDGSLSDILTERDFAAGLWDGCVVDLFEVDYRNLSSGKMKLCRMTMGEMDVSRSTFKVAMLGLADNLQKIVGRLVTKTCPWKFGDPNTCRFDASTVTHTGTITGVVDRRTFSDSGRTEPDDYFGGGLITFTSGENIGQSLEVYEYGLAGGVIITNLQFERNPSIGDTYTIVAGCRKRYTEDCRTKFANTNNYGGFNALPGPDVVLGLGGTEGTQLDPTV